MYKNYTKNIGVPTGYFRKFLFIMRLTAVILLVSLMQVSAIGFAQKITISKKNAPLSQIINEIRSQSGYDFFYSNQLLKKANPVTINVKEASLEEVLMLCFSNQPLTYKVDDKVVMLKEKTKENSIVSNLLDIFNNIDVRISVLDETGGILPGATITVKGTNRKVVSGADGKFFLTNVDESAVLVITYLGYATQEVKLKKGQTTVTVRMKPSANDMNDVVVTGIFNKPKESYTGAERTITEKELKQFQGRNLFTTIGNIDPSFYVVPNNASGADPNKIPDIQLRGTRSLPNIDQIGDETVAKLNTPLIILDGFESTLQRMLDLDNNEILSITLLKDGSATALYGSRGANGVVVIRTKEPVPGRLRLSYVAGLNLSIPDLGSYNLLNSADKLELERLSGYYGSSTRTPEANIGLQQYYNQVLAQVTKGVNTDWLSIPLRTEVGQTHNLKIEGGDETFRYDLALHYNNLNGAMKGSGRNAFNGTINLSYKYRNLTFRNNLVVGQTKQSESPYGAFSDYVKLNPYWEPYDAAGNVTRYFSPYNYDYWTMAGFYGGKPYANPLYDAMLNTYNIGNYTSITNNFMLDWAPIPKMYVRGGLSVSSNMSTQDNFKPASHSSFSTYSDADLFRKGSYAYSSGKSLNYTGQVTAGYSDLFAEKHRVSIAVNLDANQIRNTNYTFDAEGFPDESIDLLSMALQYKQNATPTGGESTTRRIGAVANANYALKDRYLADFTYRIDGASQFGVNRRFAPFWSAGLGWNLHYEDFVKNNLPFVSRLKIRGSYGSTGTTQFGAYQALGTYSYIVKDRYKTWLGTRQNALGNADLEWQKTDKFDIGMELELFKSRLILQGDVYLEKTSNLLSSLELPYANGFANYNENIGSLQQKGFEASAVVWLVPYSRQKLAWSVTANIAHNQDRIIKLSEAMKAANASRLLALKDGLSITPNTIIQEGASQNTIYAVRSLGIDPSTGKELFLDDKGEVTYSWRPQYRVAAGVNQPRFRGNLSTMVRYGSFSVNTSLGFRFGGQIYNQTLIDKIENADRLMNVDSRVFTDRWLQPGDQTFFRGLNEITAVNASTRFVQNETTFTLQNVNMTYDVTSKRLLKKMGMQSLSIAANSGELFYISTVPQERGTAYPFTRQFSMSVYASF
ncbi:SusC/RagA family TonB-linked outer membrane protein [Pedobacter sp. MC2016-14]|uniref:SusC/RagA family TonB-linked outer membrane protein n=1 Tax=Pedobacter sp. MC2016-14 TaxID=2897327 RepID=UPI001E49AEDE|nr:SusC/RagA family TonB-linked outer membrane protein [Pedobacter sp. MC2016-14]MCD0488714.1 SusC/RagA family TonB-linked outer membrane protein [Pedobacter sp. MC2016-14]